MNNSVAAHLNLNTQLLHQQQKMAGRKIVSNNLLSSRLNAPVQNVPIAPLPTASASCSVSTASSSLPHLLAQQPPQTIQMPALTSQLNAPPVIAPSQACFSLPTANNSFTYTIPNKVINSHHPVKLPVASNVQSDISNGNRRQANAISEQLSGSPGTVPGLSALLAGKFLFLNS
jgi:hypothetical protein